MKTDLLGDVNLFIESMGTWPLDEKVLAIAPESTWENIIIMMMDHEGVRWTRSGVPFNFAQNLRAIDAYLIKGKHMLARNSGESSK